MKPDKHLDVRSSLFEGPTKLAVSILQTAREPDKVLKHGRYFGIPAGTNLQKDCFERFLNTSKVQDLLNNRPSQQWPDLEEMVAMPKAGLGWCLQQPMEKLGPSILPLQKLLEPESYKAYFISRTVRCHEIHHTVLGLPITVAGEAAHQHFMPVMGRALLILEFCPHGCCVVPTNRVSVD